MNDNQSIIIKRRRNWVTTLKRERQLWIIATVALAYIAVFYITPMLGNYIAFINFRPARNIFQSDFVGLKNFTDFFILPDVWNVLRNTLVMGGLNITIGFVSPIVLALLLNELRLRRYKRVVQTISYLPHFVSWVVVASIATTLLGNEGAVNELLLMLGLVERPVNILNNGGTYWAFITTLNIWKGIGYGSIIYISAIAGVDQELYQAGAVDGLGRWGMVWHITLPGIATTIVMLFILNTGQIINGGFEQHLLLGTPTTREYYETIDTFVYRYGIELGRYSFAAAVGLLKGVISVILLSITNFIVRKATEMSLF